MNCILGNGSIIGNGSFFFTTNDTIQESTAVTTISNFSGTNVTENINTGPYIVPNYNIYAFLNSSPQPTSNVAPTNTSGTCVFSVATTTTFNCILVGGGGGGGAGANGRSNIGAAGGGGGGGQVIYQSFTLSPGTYPCSFQIGGGGGGGVVNASPNTSFVDGQNGYGYLGGNTTLSINNTTYTAIGGSSGGSSHYFNGCVTGAYGGGAGGGSTIQVNALKNGSAGLISYAGGSSSNRTSGGGGGGAGGNGMNGNTGNTIVSGPGGNGGLAITNNTIPSLNFSPSMYFSAGGGGSFTNNILSPTNFSYSEIPVTTPTNNIGGSGSGSQAQSVGSIVQNSAYYCTSGAQNTGSGGGGCNQTISGLNGSTYAGSGGCGIIIISF